MSPLRCVVNEEGPYTFTLPPGTYKIVANYFPGNNFRLVTDTLGSSTSRLPRRRPRRLTTHRGTRAALR